MPKQIELTFGQPSPMQTIAYRGDSDSTTLIVHCASVLERHPEAKFALIGRLVNGYLWNMTLPIAPDENGDIRYTFTRGDVSRAGRLYVIIKAIDGTFSESSDPYLMRIASTIYSDKNDCDYHCGHGGGFGTAPRPPYVDEILNAVKDLQVLKNITASAHGVDNEPTVDVISDGDSLTFDFGIPRGAEGSSGESAIDDIVLTEDGTLKITLTDGREIETDPVAPLMTTDEAQSIYDAVLTA